MPTLSRGNKVMLEIRNGDFYDPWGLAMEWRFAIAEVVYVEFGEIMAHFRPSPMLKGRDDLGDDYASGMLFDMIDDQEIDFDDLEYAYTIMGRYAQLCKLAGKDY